MYKCITKILANRLRPCLANIVSKNQTAFIPNRSIAENVLLAQELVKNYHRDTGPARCAIKVDLMKASGSIHWEFVIQCLLAVGTPLKFVAWNMEAIMKYVWLLFTQAGSLWVAWVKFHLLKNQSFWCVAAPKSCSWGWKKILKIRNLVWPFIKSLVRDGSSISLWHDNWHLKGPFYQKFDHRVVYDLGSTVNAKVSSVMSNKAWNWGHARSKDIVAILSKLSLIDHVEEDKVL